MATATAVPQAPTSPIDLCQKPARPKGVKMPPISHVVGKGAWMLEPKFDGHRLLAYVTESGVHLYTSTGNPQDGKLLEVEAELAQLPPGTWIDGEAVALMLDGDMVVHEWNAVQKCLGCSDLVKARARADTITFVAFDLIAHDGIDARSLPFAKRRDLLERIFAAREWSRVMLTPQVAPTEANLAAFIAQGFEGGVVKALSAPYASGKRGAGQIKLKPQATRDFVVMGYKPGESGFEGLIGSIIFGAYEGEKLVECGRCSGMDMATRQRLSKHGEDFVGSVIEVAHMGSVGEHYRHPQFRRMRPDKSPQECMI